MAKAKEAAIVLQVPVYYGNLNVGDETCRLSVSIERTKLTLPQADKNFCGRRLTGTLLARFTGHADQQSIPGADADMTVGATFDAKSFNVKRKSITAGLTFSLTDIDVAELSKFAQREGILTITDIEAIPEGKEKAEPAGEGE